MRDSLKKSVRVQRYGKAKWVLEINKKTLVCCFSNSTMDELGSLMSPSTSTTQINYMCMIEPTGTLKCSMCPFERQENLHVQDFKLTIGYITAWTVQMTPQNTLYFGRKGHDIMIYFHIPVKVILGHSINMLSIFSFQFWISHWHYIN